MKWKQHDYQGCWYYTARLPYLEAGAYSDRQIVLYPTVALVFVSVAKGVGEESQVRRGTIEEMQERAVAYAIKRLERHAQNRRREVESEIDRIERCKRALLGNQ